MAAGSVRILVVGSGYVAAPCVDYLLRRPENRVTIASLHRANAQKLASRFDPSRVAAVQLTVTDDAALDALVAQHSLVISLIPYAHHATIIKSAVRNRKHFVSTSYINPQMAELDGAVKEAGIVCLNEIGVDPGVDHLYAMETIDRVHAQGGKVVHFTSYCGGLPAPECSNNPLGYKFSWSPRGVLLAAGNAAKFWQDGQIVEIPGPELLRRGPRPIDTGYKGFALEGYPNRDSTPYRERYRIPEARTILRGTLRYKGNPRLVLAFADNGFLSDEPVAWLQAGGAPVAWLDAMGRLLGCAAEPKAVFDKFAANAGLQQDSAEGKAVLTGLRWLGMLSADEQTPLRGSRLEALCGALEARMQYGPGERDMVLLQHRFEIEWPSGKQETRLATLLEFGVPGGYSAMGRTVGVPCGVAAQLILDGRIATPGVLAPLTPDLYEPLIEELRKEHIECVEEVISH